MNPYADTGFLCSVYTPDANTTKALAAMQRLKEPLAFTWLHQF